MIKFLSAAACLAVITFHCYSQDQAPPAKKFNHYAGIQANELLRQLFNLSNTTPDVTNPYLIIYSLSPVKGGWGGHAGLGYTYRWIEDKTDGASRITKVNDLFFRVGLEKKVMLGRKFEAGMALDLSMGFLNDQTSSLSVTNLFNAVDSVTTNVTDKTTTIGGGPQFSLSYYLSDNILLSTETTFYYHAQKTKENIYIEQVTTDLFNNFKTYSTSNFNSEVVRNGFSIVIPVSIFLVVKF